MHVPEPNKHLNDNLEGRSLGRGCMGTYIALKAGKQDGADVPCSLGKGVNHAGGGQKIVDLEGEKEIGTRTGRIWSGHVKLRAGGCGLVWVRNKMQ